MILDESGREGRKDTPGEPARRHREFGDRVVERIEQEVIDEHG